MRCIYKIINAANNKFYVGSAVNYEKRKARHLWRLRRGDHANRHLQAAWLKYGEQAFVFAVVQVVPETDDLLAAENVWLHEHVGQDYCYNIASDAMAPTRGFFKERNPMWGKTFSHTEDAKARIGAASQTRVQSEDEKAKRRATMRGKPQSAETRAKISATLSGEGNFWYGKKRPEHGQKVSKAIVVTDPAGNVSTYPSIAALRAELGLKPPTVNRAVKSEKPLTRGKFSGWTFKYVASGPGA